MNWRDSIGMFGQHRRYCKGGGGGDGGAGAREAERQARIREATASINKVFNEGNRKALYDQQRDAIRDLNSREVNRQASEAERANRFGLARSGLMGGSADVDAAAELNRRTNEGLLQAGGIADASAADLRAADERSRANLISMAQSGIDSGTAGGTALSQLASNADAAAAQRGGASIGGLFNDLGMAYMANQVRKAQQDARWGWGQPVLPNDINKSYAGT